MRHVNFHISPVNSIQLNQKLIKLSILQKSGKIRFSSSLSTGNKLIYNNSDRAQIKLGPASLAQVESSEMIKYNNSDHAQIKLRPASLAQVESLEIIKYLLSGENPTSEKMSFHQP